VELELVSIDGSFKTTRDGALPGILIPAAPRVGDAYRQEAGIGNAEDAVEVLSVTGDETVPGASCAGNCLVTREFTPLEPVLDAHNRNPVSRRRRWWHREATEVSQDNGGVLTRAGHGRPCPR
jgi:hypothetical protein